MHKIFIVARTEFASAVRTKAFVASILMLPIIYGLMFFVQVYASRADTRDRKFAVVDRTGILYPAIKIATEQRNAKFPTANGKKTAPAFLPEQVLIGNQSSDDLLIALSDRVRKGELEAFVEIPADTSKAILTEPASVKYYSNNPNYNDLRGFLDVIIGAAARAKRYQEAGLDPLLSLRIDRKVGMENLGLASRADNANTADGSKSGSIVEGKKNDPIRSFFLPFVMAMLIFVVTMNGGPQLVTAVMEEKISRISEMLLGSITTFELMMGKLIGNAAVALVTTGLYLGSAYFAAYKNGYADMITPGLLATMLLFITISIFLFGSLYMAVGAACSEMRDMQSLMTPVLMLSILPITFAGPIIQNPSSPLATTISLFPFATPTIMPMRMALTPAPPAWQVVLSIVLTLATAIACVWASAKIYRTGLLMHGKAPTFREMARWVVAN